jgi:hypothetical protein
VKIDGAAYTAFITRFTSIKPAELAKLPSMLPGGNAFTKGGQLVATYEDHTFVGIVAPGVV